MTIIEQIKNVKKKVIGKISFDENLSKFSWFNLGGPAKVIFRPKNLNELSFFLKQVDHKNKIQVIGVGSNTLIRDGGYDGIIIKFGKSFSHLSLLKETMTIHTHDCYNDNDDDNGCFVSLPGDFLMELVFCDLTVI